MVEKSKGTPRARCSMCSMSFSSRSTSARPAAVRTHSRGVLWFSAITENWRGRPLVSREVVVNLIGHTTTRSGLAIRSELDANSYPTGQPVTAKQMESLSLKRDKFQGDWNYSLTPREA